MKVPGYRSLELEDVQNVPPKMEWIKEYCKPIHAQLAALTLACQQNISVDNLAAEKRELTFLHDEPVDVKLQVIKTKPIGAIVLSGEAPVLSFLATPIDVSSIQLTATFEDEGAHVLTVLIFGA